MVCIPCIVIPFLLWVYHKYIQPWVYPIVSKIWTPKVTTGNGDVTKGSGDVKKCPFNKQPTNEAVAGGDDKKNE
uniref:Uncharacterized protein n=1 Tax=Ciona intestinalis TaxID=7719 RepID=H2Y0S8_CIOIN